MCSHILNLLFPNCDLNNLYAINEQYTHVTEYHAAIKKEADLYAVTWKQVGANGGGG